MNLTGKKLAVLVFLAGSLAAGRAEQP